jgi:hypothetical protein
MRNLRSRVTRFKYCFAFFFLIEVGLFALLMLFGRSRPASGQGFVLYWFEGPLGFWLQEYEILSDFRWLGFFVAFVINPALYALLIYPVVWLRSFLNRQNEVPTLKIPHE